MNLNEIYQGDCALLMQELLPNIVDLTVTSPPYGDLRSYTGYSLDFEDLAASLYRVTKTGGVVVWVVGDETNDGSESGDSFRQVLNFVDLGFNLHDTMIYDKDCFRFPFSNRYHQVFEYMFVLSKGKPKTFNPIRDRLVLHSHDNRKQHIKRKVDGSFTYRKSFLDAKHSKRYNIWRYSPGAGKSTLDAFAFEHPAIFPEALAADHIRSWSNPGDLVLDPMCGSGTTCKMAKILGRRFLGFDISAEYVALAQRRIAGVPLSLPFENLTT